MAVGLFLGLRGGAAGQQVKHLLLRAVRHHLAIVEHDQPVDEIEQGRAVRHKHQRAAVRGLGQMGGNEFERICRGNGCAEAGFEEFPWRQPKRSSETGLPWRYSTG